MTDARGTSRGVSEALSFVLVFALILGSIAVVYTVGLGGLQDARDHERINNAERAFEVLGENADDIVLRGAPSRSTQIRMSDATLSVEDSTSIQVSGHDPATGEAYELPAYQLRSIVFVSGDSAITYVGGAVIRNDGAGAGIMTREPSFVFDGDRAVIQIIQLSSAGSVSVGGDQVVQVRTERTLRSNDVIEDRTFESIQLDVSTENPVPWREYFESQGLSCEGPQPGAGEDGLPLLTCEYDGDDDIEHHSVVRVDIDVTFE